MLFMLLHLTARMCEVHLVIAIYSFTVSMLLLLISETLRCHWICYRYRMEQDVFIRVDWFYYFLY